MAFLYYAAIIKYIWIYTNIYTHTHTHDAVSDLSPSYLILSWYMRDREWGSHLKMVFFKPSIIIKM